MTDCDNPWATQDEIGRPYCQACGKPWEQVRKEEAMNRHRCECSICTERGAEIDRVQADRRELTQENDTLVKTVVLLRAEIDRLQDAKRRAMALADERAKEANRLRRALKLFADEASWRLNGSCDPNSGAFRGLEIAQAALTDEVREPRTGAGSLD